MSTLAELQKQYPYVMPWQIDIVVEWGDQIRNTGGNEPLELINDLSDPRNRNMARTNVVRFTLAVAVESQVSLLYALSEQKQIRKTAEQRRATRRAWNQRRRDANIALGLTAAGDERVMGPSYRGRHEEFVTRVREGLERGLTHEDIASDLQVQPLTVSRRLQKHGPADLYQQWRQP